MTDQEWTFVPLPESLPELTVGLLGVKIPREWGMSLDAGQWNFMRDMRLEEIERRILAIEAAQGTEAQRAETVQLGSVHDGPVAESDAPACPENPCPTGTIYDALAEDDDILDETAPSSSQDKSHDPTR